MKSRRSRRALEVAMHKLLTSLFVAGLALMSLPIRADTGTLSPAQIATIVLTETEKRIIGSYYQRAYDVWTVTQAPGKGKKKHGALPPGLAKKGTLPPGLAKQLARNGTLPPGLARRELPDDLLVQLRPRPVGYEFVLVDDRVLLIQAATNLILDVLSVAAADPS
jgi:hypothetical protein